MYIDEPSTSFFIHEYALANQRTEQEFDSEVFSLVAEVDGNSKEVLKAQSVRINEFQGREYIYRNDKISCKLLIINKGNRILLLQFRTEDRKGISRGPVNRVFNSFLPLP